MASLWRPILHTEDEYIERLVLIMHEMDPLFRALAPVQIATWIDPNDGGTYAGSTVNAFAWFPREEDKDFAERMQLVFMGRYQEEASEGQVLMIGWAPAQSPNDPVVLDDVIVRLLELCQEWLLSIQADGSVKAVRGVQCKEVQSNAGRCLKEQLYWRAAIEPLKGTAAPPLKLVAQRDLGDAFFWRAEIG